MNDPKVSVIVPVYNVEKYIDRCLHSLVNQTLQELEIIIRRKQEYKRESQPTCFMTHWCLSQKDGI